MPVDSRAMMRKTRYTTLAAVASLLATTAPLAFANDSLPAGTDRTGRDWLDLLNDSRFEDCSGGPGLAPLREDRALVGVAQRYADGGSLQQALEASRYLTEQAAAVRIDAVRLDARTVRDRVREQFCARLGDPQMDVAATVQRGNSLWLVIAAAAPSATPTPPAGDADDAAEAGVPDDIGAPIADTPPDAGTTRAPDGIEYDILAQVNEARARPRRCGSRQYAAVPPLRYSAELADASQAHAIDMARRGYFDHDTPEGVPPKERLARTGYQWSLTGENIARGDMGADEAMAGWLRSPGHCANIMEPRFSEMGFGIAADGDRKGALYWVQTFAAPRGDESPR
jgi:uncharacterized protein YkwD